MWDLIANNYHEEDGTGYALMFNTSDRYYLDVMYVMYRCRPLYNSICAFYSLNISENEKENIEKALVEGLRNNGVLRSEDYMGSEGSSRLF